LSRSLRSASVVVLEGTTARLMHGAAAALALGACVVLYAIDPARPGFYPTCPFFALTGWYCPGCGTLRGLHQLLRGDPGRAFGLNPLTTLLLPVVIYGLASAGLGALRGRGLPSVFVPPSWIRGLLALVVAFWIGRNLDMALLAWMAP
jgi:Protein of unknown function (DUF2752)